MAMLINRPFDPKKGYPVGPHRSYKCLICTEVLPSRPKNSMQCRCGNIHIDVDVGRMGARDHSKMLLLEEPGHPFLNAISRVATTYSQISDTLAKLTRPQRFRR